MGRKLRRSGQHFYFYITTLILFALLGCVTPEKPGKVDTGMSSCPKTEATDNDNVEHKDILYSRKLLAKGDYRGALEKVQNILSLSRNGNSDEALFQAGLIYAHHMNPDKDFKKSRYYFTKLISDHPESRLVEQAKIWVGVLDVIEKSKQVDIEIEKKRKQLTQ